MVPDEFGELVVQYYEPLYKFAFSLTRTEADASDLTQQTFCLWATNGHHLPDRSKVKIHLFTTLHRIFLEAWRRQAGFPHRGSDEVASEDLPAFSPASNNHMDSTQLLKALAKPYLCGKLSTPRRKGAKAQEFRTQKRPVMGVTLS